MSTESEWCRDEARRREKLHKEAGDYQQNLAGTDGEETNYMGLLLEKEIERLTGIPVTCLYRPGGDGGRDFLVPMIMDRIRLVYKLDGKCAQKPAWLLCEVGKTQPTTIYVLGHYVKRLDTATVLGWQWGSEMLSLEPRLVRSKNKPEGVWNNWWPGDDLRDMDELLRRQVK